MGLNPELGLGAFRTCLQNKEVYLITNGKDAVHGVDRVSTQPATLTAYAAITSLKPHFIISAGTAGGLKKSEIGDVYYSNQRFFYIDRRINLDKFREYGLGGYNYFPLSGRETLGLKPGVIATGSSLDPSPTDLNALKELDADVVDMEAAAVADVAQMFKVNMIAIKSVTNFLDKDLHTDFEKNYNIAVTNLAEKVRVIIEKI